MKQGKIIKPPQPVPYTEKSSIFLAGSIEMGNAPLWQPECGEKLSNAGWIVFDPRRDDWDSSWEQSIENENFKGQVVWELEAMEEADIVLFYFAPGTMSPISLLELGLNARNKMTVVICPDGFWRKGNVDIVCERYNVKRCNDFDEVYRWLEVN